MNEREIEFREGFGCRVRAVRKTREFSQQRLGDETDVVPKHLSRIELGEVTPSVFIAFRIAKALGVSLDALTGLNNEPEDPKIAAVAQHLRKYSGQKLDQALRLLKALDE